MIGIPIPISQIFIEMENIWKLRATNYNRKLFTVSMHRMKQIK